MIESKRLSGVKTKAQRIGPRMHPFEARTFIKVVLAMGVAVNLLLFAITSLPAFFKYNTMVVTSGSMSPAILTGDAVLVKRVNPTSIKVGDVVTFVPFGEQHTVTHRVTAIKDVEGSTYVQTKGDANATPDGNLVALTAIVARVEHTLPKMGYVLVYSARPLGKILFIGLPLFILLVQELFDLTRTKARQSPGSPAPSPLKAESNATADYQHLPTR